MSFVRLSPSFDPWSALASLQSELDRVFEHPLWRFDAGPSARGVFPPINVFQDADAVVIRLEVPGVAPESVSITAQGRTLTVKGQREIQRPENASLHRRERAEGLFSRSLQLPADLEPGRAEAAYKHGLLTIRVPKREEAKPRQIEVKAA